MKKISNSFYLKLYSLLFYCILPFLPLRLLLKGRKAEAYRARWHERFAKYKTAPLKESIWVHAVSLGESIAAIPLIKELQKKYPDTRLIVTTMTPTGSERLQKTFGNSILQLYVPYDYPRAVNRFLNHFNPKFLIIIETELWPNILYYCKNRDIPIFLVNARLSERSVSRYKLCKTFAKEMLESLTKVFAQSNKDGKHFLELGLDENKLLVTGNIKFDIQVPEDIHDQGLKLRQKWGVSRSIFIAASTHKGEEERILIAFAKIVKNIPNTLLVIVPRHPERFTEVFNMLNDSQFNVVRYSQSENELISENTNIILGDVMGKLLLFYAASDVAFVGGSFVPVGGHNILEPLALGVPAIIGPNLQNILEISALLLKENAMFKVEDENELAKIAIKLLQDQNLRQIYRENALRIISENKGVLRKIMQFIA